MNAAQPLDLLSEAMSFAQTDLDAKTAAMQVLIVHSAASLEDLAMTRRLVQVQLGDLQEADDEEAKWLRRADEILAEAERLRMGK
jgi:hypothetical protein